MSTTFNPVALLAVHLTRNVSNLDLSYSFGIISIVVRSLTEQL